MGRGHVNRRYSVTACFDGNKRVVSGSEDGSIYIWDINNSKSVVQKLQGHNGKRHRSRLKLGSRFLGANVGRCDKCWENTMYITLINNYYCTKYSFCLVVAILSKVELWVLCYIAYRKSKHPRNTVPILIMFFAHWANFLSATLLQRKVWGLRFLLFTCVFFTFYQIVGTSRQWSLSMIFVDFHGGRGGARWSSLCCSPAQLPVVMNLIGS